MIQSGTSGGHLSPDDPVRGGGGSCCLFRPRCSSPERPNSSLCILLSFCFRRSVLFRPGYSSLRHSMATSPRFSIYTAWSWSHHRCIPSGSSSSLLHCFCSALSSWLLHHIPTASPTCVHRCITWALPHHGFTASARPRPHLRFSASPRPCPYGCCCAHGGLTPWTAELSASARPRDIFAALPLLGLVLCPVSQLLLAVVLCAASKPVRVVWAPPA